MLGGVKGETHRDDLRVGEDDFGNRRGIEGRGPAGDRLRGHFGLRHRLVGQSRARGDVADRENMSGGPPRGLDDDSVLIVEPHSGHVEPQDGDLFASALRELQEEVGFRDPSEAAHPPGAFDIDIHTIPERSDEPAHFHFDVRFLFRAEALDAVKASEEVNAGRWVPLRELTLTETDESVMRAARKLGELSG